MSYQPQQRDIRTGFSRINRDLANFSDRLVTIAKGPITSLINQFSDLTSVLKKIPVESLANKFRDLNPPVKTLGIGLASLFAIVGGSNLLKALKWIGFLDPKRWAIAAGIAGASVGYDFLKEKENRDKTKTFLKEPITDMPQHKKLLDRVSHLPGILGPLSAISSMIQSNTDEKFGLSKKISDFATQHITINLTTKDAVKKRRNKKNSLRRRKRKVI